MSDKPETLAAIVAEIRNAAKDSYAEKTAKRLEDHEATGTRDALDIKDAIQCLRDDDKYLLDLADRIEAAAERMRDAYCELCKEKDAAYDRLLLERDKAIKARAPGNAAAMRESIETMRRYAMLPQEQLSLSLLQRTIHEKCDAALAAPARNCDRFATAEEARVAFQNLRGHKILADVELWDSMDEAGALVRWLFAPAEGGAE